MSELQCVARLRIHDGKLDEFKRLVATCADIVRMKDTGTLQYEVYFNADETECIVFERYRDSDALLEHHRNLGDTMTAIFATCEGSGEICGTPSAELMAQLDGSPVQVYRPLLIEPVTPDVDEGTDEASAEASAEASDDAVD